MFSLKKALKESAMKKYLLLVCFCLNACQTTNEPRYYVSPAEYQSYNCSQLVNEMQRISLKREQLIQAENNSQVLEAALTAFAISRGYGVNQNENVDKLEALNNTYEVLDRMIVKNGCFNENN
jgi:hypothetical protein